MTRLLLKSDCKMRLDEILRKALPQKLEALFPQNSASLSNSKIRRLIIAGKVFVSKKQMRVPSFVVSEGSEIQIEFDGEKFFYEKETADISFELTAERVIYEDEYIIAVNKPPHFPTEETFVDSRDCLHDAVVRYLQKKNPALRNPPYVGIVHRLDRDTSGVIVFSKQRPVNKALFEAFDSSKIVAHDDGKNGAGLENAKREGRNAKSEGRSDRAGRSAKKIYVALCVIPESAAAADTGTRRDNDTSSDTGTRRDIPAAPSAGNASLFLKSRASMRAPSGTGHASCSSSCNTQAELLIQKENFSVQNYLGRVSKKSEAARYGIVNPLDGGRFARTEFTILERRASSTETAVLIQAHPVTGRTHQIRVHLSQSGLPIKGDVLYGGVNADRVYLHARLLSIPHPVTGEIMEFTAPLPF